MLNMFPFRRMRKRPFRQDSFEAVDIEMGTGACPIAGILKDISETGALIHVDKGAEVPSRVRLSIRALNIRAEADVRWRRDESIGVRFIEKIDLDAAPRRRRRDRREVIAAQFRPRSKDRNPASAG